MVFSFFKMIPLAKKRFEKQKTKALLFNFCCHLVAVFEIKQLNLRIKIVLVDSTELLTGSYLIFQMRKVRLGGGQCLVLGLTTIGLNSVAEISVQEVLPYRVHMLLSAAVLIMGPPLPAIFEIIFLFFYSEKGLISNFFYSTLVVLAAGE